MKKTEALLTLLGEMERFSPQDDQLSRLLAETENRLQELSEDELEWVAAASKAPEWPEIPKGDGKK